MAGAMGLEPTAFCVTGRRYNQLNYAPTERYRDYKKLSELRQAKGRKIRVLALKFKLVIP